MMPTAFIPKFVFREDIPSPFCLRDFTVDYSAALNAMPIVGILEISSQIPMAFVASLEFEHSLIYRPSPKYFINCQPIHSV